MRFLSIAVLNVVSLQTVGRSFVNVPNITLTPYVMWSSLDHEAISFGTMDCSGEQLTLVEMIAVRELT
jgi:hypothetical protein